VIAEALAATKIPLVVRPPWTLQDRRYMPGDRDESLTSGVTQTGVGVELDPTVSRVEARLGAPQSGSSAETQNAPALDADRYEDLGPIGAGGMGEVRRVHDRVMGRALAMKVLSYKLADSLRARERFLHEARITSNLQHPGIVAVHDTGVLPDGRPWYTMREVRGQTFRAFVERLQTAATSDAVDRALEEVVEALVHACDAMAYAHGRGVIHRDIKPANLMVGRFGEVQVMDWGLALDLAEQGDEPLGRAVLVGEAQDGFLSVALARTVPGSATDSDGISGTLAYMSPEQARGERLTAASDVYSLGAVLYEAMAGEPPYVGSGRQIWLALLSQSPRPLDAGGDSPLRPVALCAIVERAMNSAVAERHANAGLLAEALRNWLDGRRRERRALEVLAQADALAPAIEALRRESKALREEAAALLSDVEPHDPVARKIPAWKQQEEASDLERAAAVKEVAWQQVVQSALNDVPDLPAAHARLADHHRRRHEEAAALRDTEGAARAEALLSIHDRGKHAAYLRGDSGLSVVCEAPGSCFDLHRYEMIDRRLQPQLIARDLPAPLRDYTLPAGSYLVVARAAGHHDVRYPVLLPRGGEWDATRPGDRAPSPLWLPPLGELAADDIYVPAGWFWSGGDPAAIEPLPRRRIWADDFVIKKHPVTRDEYLAYLNGLVDAGRPDEAQRRAPKRLLSGAQRDDAPYWPQGMDGRFRLDARYTEADQGSWPVSLVDWHDAVSFASHRADKAWRLPSELEWEKAGRGSDGRCLPWGDHFEPTFACVIGSHDGDFRPFAVDAFATDVSAYGVRGLAGNMRDWCLERWGRQGPPAPDGVLEVTPASSADDAVRSVRGGAWTSVVEAGRMASRFAVRPDERYRGVGLRLVRPATALGS
jgi:eukaryotic-like serine/threonine-protein kinase